MNLRAAMTAALAAMMLAPLAAHADPAEPTSVMAPAKRWYFRVGPLHMQPNTKSDEVQITGVSGAASLAVMDGPIAGSSTTISDFTIPAVIVGYRWPTSSGELAVETILATPVTLDLHAGGTLANQSIAPTILNGIETGVPPLGPELGTTKALPPTLTAVYRHNLTTTMRPYVGAGLSYLYTYDSKITNPVLTEVVPPKLDIANGWSGVLQAGLDVRLSRFTLTADVKYMTGFDIRAKVSDIYVRSSAVPLYESVYVGDATLNVHASPLVVQVGAGLDF